MDRLKNFFNAIKKPFFTFFNMFTVSFLLISLFCLYTAEKEKKEWEYLRENGIQVEATIVDIIYTTSDEDHYTFFEYEVDGKTYIYEEQNYSDGLIMGKTITAYIYPESPENLIIYDGSTASFFVWFMLGLALVSGFGFLYLVYSRPKEPKKKEEAYFSSSL